MDLKTLVTAPPASTAADLAKAALRRLVLAKLEPTPENFARAYHAESGRARSHGGEHLAAMVERLISSGAPFAEPERSRALTQALLDGRWEQAEREIEALGQGEPPGAALAGLIERIVRALERGGGQWTTARRKESLQRVLSGSRGDAHLLQRRLSQLVASWDGDAAVQAAAALEAPPKQAEAGGTNETWASVAAQLAAGLQAALGQLDPAARDAAPLFAAAAQDAPSAEQAAAAAGLSKALSRALGQRERLVSQLSGLCAELGEGLSDLAEDESWTRGQLDAMRQTLSAEVNSRSVRAAGELLRRTREQQGRLRAERAQARDALKGLINQMLSELGDLGSQTGRFHDNVGRYAEAIDKAESLDKLTGVVGALLSETRDVQELVGQTQARLHSEHALASQMSQRVAELESELRRLSDEVATDQLTQIANRRGLMQAFETARAQAARDGQPLAIGLLDVDNFKRLNDELGHSAGDEALRSLAGVIAKSLRPADAVARFGGEEFVVLLPATEVDDGQQILTRLQRSLSVGLFMHERKTVFVTFSAGVTLHRANESLEQALERADAALYEAKRSGKNRTCIA